MGPRNQKIRFVVTSVQNGGDRETDRASTSTSVSGASGHLDTSTADQANQDHDDGNDEQDVDEAADGVGSDQAKYPQDQENDCDCIEHDDVLVSYENDFVAVKPVSLFIAG
jgi:hypothetical protein